MKLLFCQSCCDVFNLASTEKSCGCGKTKGNYIDDNNAVYSGQYAVPLGFRNSSFLSAIAFSNKIKGDDFIAFVIPEENKTFKKV